MRDETKNTEASAEDLGPELLTEVWKCSRCTGLRDFFEVDDRSGNWFRFPPIIGCHRRPLLLFVGINPRVSYSGTVRNDEMHLRILTSFSDFAALASNRDRRQAYIAEYGGESTSAAGAGSGSSGYTYVRLESNTSGT
jgi:hypothetical protein